MDKELYSIRVNWSDEDEAFVAIVPEFPGLSAFGETRKEATEEAGIVLEAFIEIFVEDGKKLPEPEKIHGFSGQTRLRMPKSLHKKLSMSAEREGVSMNQYMVSLISERQAEKSTTKRILGEIAETFISKVHSLVKTATFASQSKSVIFDSNRIIKP